MAEGGGFDPCECIYGHESTMQRLLNLLRHTQAQCTDNDCLTNPSLPGDPASNSPLGNPSLWLAILGWIVLATALFVMRPRSLRWDSGKPGGGSAGGSGRGNDRDPPVVS